MLSQLATPLAKSDQPGWLWTAKDKSGKPAGGFTRGPIHSREQLIEMLKLHFGNLDYSSFTCERRDDAPVTAMFKPVPFKWFEIGTNRLVREIMAGLRPDRPGLRSDGSYQCAAPGAQPFTEGQLRAAAKDRSKPRRIISPPSAGRVSIWRNRGR